MVEPDRVWAHHLECAALISRKGDVLHWWHPPLDGAYATRCSDDHSLVAVLDGAIRRDEGEPYRAGRARPPSVCPRITARGGGTGYAVYEAEAGTGKASLLDHCLRGTRERGVSGAARLALMGAGLDDGMDAAYGDATAVGLEDVWLPGRCRAAAALLESGESVRRNGVRLPGALARRAVQLRRRPQIDRGWDGTWI